MIAAVQERGYQPLYHQGKPNHCPGCSHSWWLVGRASAECWNCGTALPLAPHDHGAASAVATALQGD
jgi:hypothetical protein